MAAAPQVVSSSSTAAFLLRCARAPQRWYYPCNAKHREPVCCSFELRPAPVPVLLHECAWSDGGTGWRAWPCALLLACWLARGGSVRGRSVLEVGCGLGLPGLAAAALGAARVVLTDCLPRLLTEAVARSVAAMRAALGGDAVDLTAALLDWDDEAPPAAGETYSTEQAVRADQRADQAHGASETPTVLAEGAKSLAEGAKFDVLLASDVIYSATHAAQLPVVLAARAAPGATLCAMVPIRSAEHTRLFLAGLQRRHFDVTASVVNVAWVEAVVATQAGAMGSKAGTGAGEAAGGAGLPRGVAYDGARFALSEGDVLFVEARLKHQPAGVTVESTGS